MVFSKLMGALFGKGGESKQSAVEMESVEYQGYTITPAPMPDAGGYRINGTITRGERSHQFIRADILPGSQSCADEMIRKAKQLIDQQGAGEGSFW
ncbi:HlyU family transcriptional regulator [Neptuniibacter halophilus]|uniref:HlyU family transcriptional regulator n=1 Tax=Neptuniibacter halophilus TaxID=651666 RepID=UPI0025736181|nr:HlyU family transcriptional regulator [Neptuniibacter halophilus]